MSGLYEKFTLKLLNIEKLHNCWQVLVTHVGGNFVLKFHIWYSLMVLQCLKTNESLNVVLEWIMLIGDDPEMLANESLNAIAMYER